MKLNDWIKQYIVGKVHDDDAIATALSSIGDEFFVRNNGSNIDIIEAVHLYKYDNPKVVLHAMVEQNYLMIGKSKRQKCDLDSSAELIPCMLLGVKAKAHRSNVKDATIIDSRNVRKLKEALEKVARL